MAGKDLQGEHETKESGIHGLVSNLIKHAHDKHKRSVLADHLP
ncbi:MAG: hypothetical protein NT051_05330 [Candidatus Micrarchaeota archaeon]|nr:hypothetical protein [Candidatus Micrarchaeota archaeon]